MGTVLNRQDVDGLGLILGQNFVSILPTFISASEKTFYLNGTDRENIVLFHFKHKKRAEWLYKNVGIFSKQNRLLTK